MGVKERTVVRWQAGHPPKAETLVQLAALLGVPQAYFVATEDVAVALADLQDRVGQLTARVESLTRALEWLEAPAGDPT
jgi:transcriptional regulator with XRE-family HTH domain